MPVRLIIHMTAKPGQGAALAEAYAARCREVAREGGCQQYEIFRSALDPDRLVMLELWADQAALDAHMALARTQPRPPALAALLAEGGSGREDYEYVRTR